MNNSAAIRIINLSKEFFPRNRVIDNINLSVKKGELFCLVGTNGAGKTTLLKLLCNLILPTSGEIFINGYNVLKDSERARSSIGLVTGDERSFYWRLTGRQNMKFFATLYNLLSHESKIKIEELFKLLRIEEPDKRFQEYSSGIKQRLSIARALLNDSSVLFLDELTKGLDPSTAKELRIFIKGTLVKEKKKTVFFSTHNLREAEELADRIAFMRKGKITADGTIAELRKTMGRQDASIEDIYDYFMNKKD